MAIGPLHQRERGARSPLKTGGIGRGAVLSQMGQNPRPCWPLPPTELAIRCPFPGVHSIRIPERPSPFGYAVSTSLQPPQG